MRYISPHQRLALYATDGKIQHQFEQHELIVGDPASATDQIDATSLFKPYGILGGGKDDLEKAGLGYLNNYTSWRNFYEAPYKTGLTTFAYPATIKVISGEATFDGTTYFAGETFDITSGGTVDGTSYYAEWLPPALVDECLRSPDPFFIINVLLKGDESSDYWLYSTGYKPKNSLVSSSDDYVGWFRK